MEFKIIKAEAHTDVCMVDIMGGEHPVSKSNHLYGEECDFGVTKFYRFNIDNCETIYDEDTILKFFTIHEAVEGEWEDENYTV